MNKGPVCEPVIGSKNRVKYFIKKSKKCLTNAFVFVIIDKLARGEPRKSKPNLENDTEKKRAMKGRTEGNRKPKGGRGLTGRDSEDSKE